MSLSRASRERQKPAAPWPCAVPNPRSVPGAGLSHALTQPCRRARFRQRYIDILPFRQLKATTPDIENHIFRSVENVCLDTVIGWKHHGQTHHFLDTYDRN